MNKHQLYRQNNPEKIRALSKLSWERRKQDPRKTMLSNAKKRAADKNLPFNIDLDDIIMPEVCPVFGIKLKNNWGGRCPAPDSPSLDRVIPELGYVKGNVNVVSNKANRLKNSLTVQEIGAIWRYISDHG